MLRTGRAAVVDNYRSWIRREECQWRPDRDEQMRPCVLSPQGGHNLFCVFLLTMTAGRRMEEQRDLCKIRSVLAAYSTQTRQQQTIALRQGMVDSNTYLRDTRKRASARQPEKPFPRTGEGGMRFVKKAGKSGDGEQRGKGLTELDTTAVLFLLERLRLSERPAPKGEPAAHLQ